MVSWILKKEVDGGSVLEEALYSLTLKAVLSTSSGGGIILANSGGCPQRKRGGELWRVLGRDNFFLVFQKWACNPPLSNMVAEAGYTSTSRNLIIGPYV